MRMCSNYLKYITLCSRNCCILFNIVGPCAVPGRYPWNSRFSTRPSWPLAAIVREFNRVWFLARLLKRTKDVFRHFSLSTTHQMRKVRSSPVFHQVKASYTGGLYTHELKTSYVELTSCCCCAADGWLRIGLTTSLERHSLRIKCRGSEAHLENPMFVQVSSFCPPNLSSGTALRQTFVICKEGSKHLQMNIFAAVHSA